MATNLTRREFSAATLASVLSSDLSRRERILWPKESHYAGYEAFEQWWNEIMGLLPDCGGDGSLENMGLVERIELYAAITDWLANKFPAQAAPYKP